MVEISVFDLFRNYINRQFGRYTMLSTMQEKLNLGDKVCVLRYDMVSATTYHIGHYVVELYDSYDYFVIARIPLEDKSVIFDGDPTAVNILKDLYINGEDDNILIVVNRQSKNFSTNVDRLLKRIANLVDDENEFRQIIDTHIRIWNSPPQIITSDVFSTIENEWTPVANIKRLT